VEVTPTFGFAGVTAIEFNVTGGVAGAPPPPPQAESKNMDVISANIFLTPLRISCMLPPWLLLTFQGVPPEKYNWFQKKPESNKNNCLVNNSRQLGAADNAYSYMKFETCHISKTARTGRMSVLRAELYVCYIASFFVNHSTVSLQ
jgi:hypothetical protein